MTRLEIIVPDIVANLPPGERNILFSRAVAVCIDERIQEIRLDLERIRREIEKFENKYGMPFDEFEQTMPKGAEPQVHEDYVEWFFWVQVYREKQEMLKLYSQPLEEGQLGNTLFFLEKRKEGEDRSSFLFF
ncbi:hypothetical protein FJZ31_42940 [Candidatus Poribacteria bacterium]|nr:hypothetical protein [Candidatus Poribacteria bacterium]